MYETAEELEALDVLLATSRARATDHLRDIIHDDRALRAADVAGVLDGMKVLTLATVTSHSAPRISAVDGHFLHGAWTWSTSGTSAKARQLAARPQASVAHVDGESVAIFAHGVAVRLRDGDVSWDETIEHWRSHYGASPLEWGPDIRLYRLAPSWMVGYASNRDELRRSLGIAS